MRNVLLFIIRTFFYACQFHVPIYFLVMINSWLTSIVFDFLCMLPIEMFYFR